MSPIDAVGTLHQLSAPFKPAGRGLRANGNSAFSSASGAQSATARASATPTSASTQQSATGGGSQVLGVSQVNGEVDICQRGPANSAACQTLTTAGGKGWGEPSARAQRQPLHSQALLCFSPAADRSSGCTDIAPSAEFTCQEQARFGKCGE